jgi:hypothetical protein
VALVRGRGLGRRLEELAEANADEFMGELADQTSSISHILADPPPRTAL